MQRSDEDKRSGKFSRLHDSGSTSSQGDLEEIIIQSETEGEITVNETPEAESVVEARATEGDVTFRNDGLRVSSGVRPQHSASQKRPDSAPSEAKRQPHAISWKPPELRVSNSDGMLMDETGDDLTSHSESTIVRVSQGSLEDVIEIDRSQGEDVTHAADSSISSLQRNTISIPRGYSLSIDKPFNLGQQRVMKKEHKDSESGNSIDSISEAAGGWASLPGPQSLQQTSEPRKKNLLSRNLSWFPSTDSFELGTLSNRKTKKLRMQLSLDEAGLSSKTMKKISRTFSNDEDVEVMVTGLSLRTLLDLIEHDDNPGLSAALNNKILQIDEADDDGWTALTHATVHGKIEAVDILLDHGVDVEHKDLEGCTALHHAAREGHVHIAAKLLQQRAQVEVRDEGLWTPLLWSCYTTHLEMASLLLQHNADVNAKGIHNCTGLIWAAGKGDVELVRLLLTHGAKVDSGDKYGTTPLIWACRGGHTHIVKDLLEAGAQVDACGLYSWTPLLMAVRGNYPGIVSLLLDHSPNVNVVDQNGMTALAIACKEGSSEIAFQLMAAGAYVNLQDRSGDTNLILASKAGHKSIVEALIKRYADVDAKGKDGKTCLYWSVEKNHPSVVRVLLSANADVEIANNEGNTPLLRAVKNRNVETVQMLLDKKAKLTVTDKAGDTPLHIAMRARSKAIVELLLKNPKHSQLLYKPNRAGETPYNIDLSHQKPIMGQVFGARKLNTNEDTENMLGYDLYGSALADILTEPSLSMPITVGLYAKWGSGKSFLLKKLREEMINFAREWVDPTFHLSPLLFFLVFHIASVTSTVAWIISYHNYSQSETSFLVLLLVFVGVFILLYLILILVWQGTFRTDIHFLYKINVLLARKFNELKLLVNIVFSHPAGSQHIATQEKAHPLKLFFTDQSRVTTSAGAENSVIQIIGSLYDALESSYGKFSTRLYRAFRPKPVKSSSPLRLRKLCCIPYAALYIFSYVLLIAEIILIIIESEGLLNQSVIEEMQSETSTTQPSDIVLTLPKTELDLLNKHQIQDLVLGLLITLAVMLGVIIVANIDTIGRTMNSLVFSSRTHLQRAVAKHDLVQSEGYLQAVKREVNLMQQMVKALDSFSGQQSRLIVIVDGLDSVEQRKILSVLDTVHCLFSDPGLPFIIVLAIDPHVIIKAIELNLNQVFTDTSIGGHAYLRNMVHLPFFLQNSGLRKIKIAQQLASKQKVTHMWMESDERRWSDASVDPQLGRNLAKYKRKKKLSETIDVSVGSNLHKVSTGLELNKILLTDDYFSDTNPRSMRRLMNVIYVMGRLLKAFSIDFSWHHLSNWANITEQWPYRTSWITLYCEICEDRIEDGWSLKFIYDKVKPAIPTQKELEPMLEMDRDEKKLDAFLALHKKSLTVTNMKIFMPFTINLDPYIKKVIKEEIQNMEELGLTVLSSPMPETQAAGGPKIPANTPLTRRQAVGLSKRLHMPQDSGQFSQMTLMPQMMGMTPPVMGWPFSQPGSFPSYQPLPPTHLQNQTQLSSGPMTIRPSLPDELKGKNLSGLSVEQIVLLTRAIDSISQELINTYASKIRTNNITGKVLFHCQLDELRNVLRMNFGDWEMFKLLVVSLREEETQSYTKLNQQDSQSEPDATTIDLARLRAENKRRSQTNAERQVAMEHATLTGLLSTLNEDAKEDIINHELETALDNTENLRPTGDDDESDVLYYSNPTLHSHMSTEERHSVSESHQGLDGGERGLGRGPSTQELIWSAHSSRRGSMVDLDSIACFQQQSAKAIVHASAFRRQDSHLSEAAEKNATSIPEEAEKPLRSISKPDEPVGDEEDPYAWLSKTAPPSPREGQTPVLSEGPASPPDTDPGTNFSVGDNRSVRRTKRRESGRKNRPPRDGSQDTDLSRVSSRERLNRVSIRVKRKLTRALLQTEGGNIPAVQRAKPNKEEYEHISGANKEASEGLIPSLNSSRASLNVSCESLSSPEQRTIFKRPDVPEEPRPSVSAIFYQPNTDEDGGTDKDKDN